MCIRDSPYIPGLEAPEFNYLSPERRKTKAVRNIGGEHVPVVIADRMDGKTAVSYTHLDVYKRQSQNNACRTQYTGNQNKQA